MKNLLKLLTIPGNGVFTVHTAKDKKEKLFKSYYGTSSMEKVNKLWEKSLTNRDPEKPWIIGIPSDTGGGIQRGANWGPLAVRQELLDVSDSFVDLGDVRVIPHLLHDKYLNSETIKSCQKALYGKVNKLPVAPLSIAEAAMDELFKYNPKAKVLGIGGDHSVSYPLAKAWLNSRSNKKKAAILHFDAHTDLMDKRLGIDICFGTWTFQILEYLSSPDHIIQVGIRSSGKNKKHWKSSCGVEQFWAKDVEKLGIEKVSKKIISHFEKLGVQELYISFDIDALDIKYAAATGTPESGGLTPPDCAALIRLLAAKFNVTGADVMEVAPFVCPEGVKQRDQQSSITVAGDITKVLLQTLQR